MNIVHENRQNEKAALDFSSLVAYAVCMEVDTMIPLMIDDQYASMPWDRIDNIVFDVGNVLLAYSPEEVLGRVLPDQPELYERLKVRVFRSPYWTMMDHGTAVDNEEIARAMAGRDTELLPAVRRVVNEWIDLPAIPEGVETLRRCKAHGKRLVVLSNYKSAPFAHACQTHDFFSLFDDFVVSARVGMIKPDARIYNHLTDSLNLDPARTLFIDDSPANIETALHLGWQGFCNNRPGKMAEFFVD